MSKKVKKSLKKLRKRSTSRSWTSRLRSSTSWLRSTGKCKSCPTMRSPLSSNSRKSHDSTNHDTPSQSTSKMMRRWIIKTKENPLTKLKLLYTSKRLKPQEKVTLRRNLKRST